MLAGENQRQAEGAFQHFQCLEGGFDRSKSLVQVVSYQMNNNFRICIGLKDMIAELQFGVQFLIVLYDAVVNDGHLAGGMGMSVVLGRSSVGGPAGVANADRAGEWLLLNTAVQVDQFALGPAPVNPAIDQGCDT